jgi:hypothetical protein
LAQTIACAIDVDSIQFSLNSISLRSGLAWTSAARPLLTYTPAMIVSRLAETAGECSNGSKKLRNAEDIFEDMEAGPTPLCFSVSVVKIFVFAISLILKLG